MVSLLQNSVSFAEALQFLALRAAKHAFFKETNAKLKFCICLFAFVFSFTFIFTACGKNNTQIKIGHSGGYLSAAVYAADFDADIQQFRSNADIGYALLLGSLDAGFLDIDRLAAFSAA